VTFFQSQPHPLQRSGDLGAADREPTFLVQLLPQLLQREVGNGKQPAPQLLARLIQQLARPTALLLYPLHLTVTLKLAAQLLAVWQTYHETLGQFLQRSFATFVGGQKPPPKVI